MTGKSKMSSKSEKSDVCVPWVEWSDEELKQEKWAEPKNGPDGLFMDTEMVSLPESLQVEKWIRVRDLKYLSVCSRLLCKCFETPVLFVTTTDPIDLIVNNKHLLVSEFMRLFMSTVVYLLCRDLDDPATSEKSGDLMWNPRICVYGLNKIGKAGEYRPRINPHGKYVVRVFFMGCWRRIVVDDTVPIDKRGRALLPHTKVNFEIWLMLLAKAMLKIASLTWTERREILDFHPAVSLTGWICLSFDVGRLSPDDKWDFLMDHRVRFERILGQNTNQEAGFQASENKNESIRKRPNPVGACLFLDVAENFPVFIAAMRAGPNMSSSLSSSWKSYRWIKWALAKGLVDPVEYFQPIRCVKVVGPNTLDFHEAEKKDVEEEENSDDGFKEAFWADFNGLAPYVKVIQFFYEPKDFPYSAIVSNLLFENELPVVSSSTKKNGREAGEKDALSVKGSNPTMKYNWPRPMKRTRNEPLYLFCDSMDDKFFIINFSSFQRIVATGKLEKSNLIVERHSWFLGAGDNEPLASIVTSANRSCVFNLEAGRHLLRIFSVSESCVSMTVLSDTIFRVGDRSDMYKAMSSESTRICAIAKRISDSVNRAFESFGSIHYRDAVKNYYRSYMPSEDIQLKKEHRRLLTKMHLYFAEELVREIQNNMDVEGFNKAAHSMRVFFLDLKIGRDFVSDATSQRTQEISRNVEEFFDRAATIIQSFFRMILIKSYMYRHKSTHKEHNEIRNRLLKVSKFFDHTNEDSPIYKIIRNLRKRLEIFDEVYPYSSDFQHILQCREYSGETVNLKPNEWSPLVKLTLNLPAGEDLMAMFSLFTNLSNYVHALRVFDSESGREVFRVANNVAPFRYRRRASDTGFVIFGYGFSGNPRSCELQWSLQIISMKGDATFYQENLYPDQLPNLLVRQVSNVARVPKKNHLISSCIIRTKTQKDISLRLKVSCSEARVRARLRLIDQADHLLAQIDGTYILILPFVRLKEAMEVRADVFVLDDFCLNFEAKPHWCLQVVVDDGTYFELLEEETQPKEMNKLQKDALERGRTLRELFHSRHSFSKSLGSEESSKVNNWRRVKTENDVSTARANRIAEQMDEEENHTVFREDIFQLTNSHVYEYDDFCRNYTERLQERRALLNEFYKYRIAYIGDQRFGSAQGRDKRRNTKAREKGPRDI